MPRCTFDAEIYDPGRQPSDSSVVDAKSRVRLRGIQGCRI